MPEMNCVDILVDGVCVAEKVPLEYSMIFARAIFDKYYLEDEMSILFRKSVVAEDE